MVNLQKHFTESQLVILMGKRERANGDGALYYDKKKKIYRGQVVVKHDEEGRFKRKSVSGKNPSEVKQKMKQVELGIYSGDFLDKNNITIYHLAKQMIDDMFNLNEIKENTYITHLATLKRLQPISSIPLQQVNETMLRAYFHSRLDKSNSTIRKDYELLKRVFKEAIVRDIINKSPIQNIKLPKSSKKQEKVRALTIEEQERLLAVLLNEEVPYSPQMLLIMYTGMRMGEINALTKDDINLDFNCITVNKTISRGKNGKPVLSDTTKTEAGTRKVYFVDDIKDLLKECIDNAEGDYLFTNENGRELTTNQINMQLKRVLEKYDILDPNQHGKVTCHSLRHTYVTRMIESGMPPKVLANLIGHRDIRVTLNTYCDAFEQFQTENIIQGAEYLNQKGLSLNNKKDGSKAVENNVKIG